MSRFFLKNRSSVSKIRDGCGYTKKRLFIVEGTCSVNYDFGIKLNVPPFFRILGRVDQYG